MTDEEVRGLMSGEKVEVALWAETVKELWLPARVVDVAERRRRMVAYCRLTPPHDRTPGGHKRCHHGYVWRAAREIRRPLVLDPVASNIFADFLEERGEYKAAAILREAFPFVNASGECTVRCSLRGDA